MSLFLSTHQTSERYETYAEQFRDVFRRHSVSYGRPSDFPQLARKLVRRDAFRTDFSMLLRWIQEREEGHLTVEEMLKIVGAAAAGPRGADIRAPHVTPLMVFLSGLGGWSEISGAPKENNVSRAPDAFQVESEATRVPVSPAPVTPAAVNSASVSPAPMTPAAVSPAAVTEVRAAEERKPLNAEAREASGVSEGPGSPSAPAKVRSTARAEKKAVQRERDAAVQKQSSAHPERIWRIRQQLEELDGGAKASQEKQPLRYREITPVESPATQPWQPTFVNVEATAVDRQPDIFRAYRTNIAAEQRETSLKSMAMGAMAKITGIASHDERTLRALSRAFGFLVLLPPAVVCVLLYRDSLSIANRSSQEPFVTRVQGNELRVIDPNARRGVRGRAKPERSSGDDLPVIERGPAKIHAAGSDEAPMIAEGVSRLADMPGSKGGAENWMPILGHMDQIDVSPRVMQVEAESPRIRPAKLETPPMIAASETTMPGHMPKAVVQMSYPVVITKANAGLKGEKHVSTPGARGGVAPEGGSSTKQLDLLNPSVDVSGGLLSNNIVKFEMPPYPKAARKQGVEGDVLVRVLISDKGKIEKAVALNGPPTLRGAVEKAVRRWRYKPYVQDGQPVQVQTWVTFHFGMKEG